MHRNTFLCSPKLLDRYYADRREPLVAFAGQMTGVEGYVESTASGYLAGVNFGILTPLDRRVKGKANKNLAIANRSLAVIDAMTGKTKEESHENSR